MEERIWEVIFQLVEIIEKQNTTEVSGLKGALMFDGWKQHSIHFIGMYLLYPAPVSNFKSGSTLTKYVPRLTSVFVSPRTHEQQKQTK